MDDLLDDDIKQNEQASEVEIGRQRSNPFSDRDHNSGSRTKKHQLSDMGDNSNKGGRISLPFATLGDSFEKGNLALKRNSKLQEKQQSSIQQTLLKSLGPEPKESPINGPLQPKFQPIDRRKFSLDMDYNERVRHQDLKKLLKGKLQAWLLLDDRQKTSRQVALGIRPQSKR